MTKTQIASAQSTANIPYELAIKIRELLDSARTEHKMSKEDFTEIEERALELVSGEAE